MANITTNFKKKKKKKTKLQLVDILDQLCHKGILFLLFSCLTYLKSDLPGT